MPFLEDAAMEIVPGYENFTGKKASENFEEAVQLYYDNAPVCTLSAEELTWHIQKEVPSYYFDCSEENLQEQKELSQKARKALIDLYKKHNIVGDPYIKLGKDLFSATGGGGMNRAAPDIGSYIGKFMGQEYKNELKELAERRLKDDVGGDFSERKKKLHRAVIEDAAARAQEMRKNIDGYSMEELVDHLDEIYIYTKICNTKDTISSFSTFTPEEEQKYYDFLDPFIMDTWSVMPKVSLLASPLGEIVNAEQLSQLSRSTLLKIAGNDELPTFMRIQENNRVQTEDEIARDGKKPDEKAYQTVRKDPLIDLANGAGGLITQINDRVKDKFGATGEAKHIYQDISGNNIDEDQMLVELMEKRQPVYVLDQNTPDRLPTLVYLEKGQISLDQEAQKKFYESPPLTEPHEPYEPELRKPEISTKKVPSGIGKRWYGLCGWLESRGFGGLASALRTKDQQEYRDYENRVKEYEKKVEARNARKAAYDKTLADHEVKNAERDVLKMKSGTLLSDENLSAVRESMIQNKFGMSRAAYKAKQEEDARKAEEEKAKTAENRRKDAIRSKRSSYTSEQSKTLNAKMKEAGIPRNKQSYYTYLKKAVRDKQFSLYEADGMDKSERVASALVCRRIDQLIDDNLTMLKDGAPLSQELTVLLSADNADEAAKMLNDKIKDMQSNPALQQIAAEMNEETLQKICPVVPDPDSITSIEEVMKQQEKLNMEAPKEQLQEPQKEAESEEIISSERQDGIIQEVNAKRIETQKRQIQKNQEQYTHLHTEQVNNWLKGADLSDQETAEKIKELSAMVREKQFSLYEANDMDKRERVAAAVTCQLVNAVIEKDLTEMTASNKPLSNALTSLLNSGNIRQKLDEKINTLQDTPALQQVADGMTEDTLQAICPSAPNIKSVIAVDDVMTQVKQAKKALTSGQENPALTNSAQNKHQANLNH